MRKHTERRVLPYTPKQLFELVADIEKYPEFLPWCLAARIRERDERVIVADLAIGFRLYREYFSSKVTLSPDGPDDPRIDTAYTSGPFRHLMSYWIFHPHTKGCEIEFYMEFEFSSKILQATIELLFHEAVRRIVAAFEGRAGRLYGRMAA